MKGHKWAFFYTLGLLVVTVYIALDTFVISRSYRANASQMNTAMFSSSASSSSKAEESAVSEPTSVPASSSKKSSKKPSSISQKSSAEIQAESLPEPEEPVSSTISEPEVIESGGFLDENNYKDDNISISLSQHRIKDTDIYVADIRLSSAQYLKTAFAFDAYGKNITAATSDIAAVHNAIFAVNGDYYGIREAGFVIRNGIVYRDTPLEKDVLCVNSDGDFEVIDPYSISADDLVSRGVWQAFSFGPALVEDGAIAVSTTDEVGRAKASNPRTAIGMIEPLHYVCVVSDGRTEESKGLSLYELADFMTSLGVKTGYNLDGGGSASMVFNGRVINKPTSDGTRIAERSVSDIVYLGY